MRKSLVQYITEAAASEEKLTHLEHNEDHIVHSGNAGFHHAMENLQAVHDKLTGKSSNVDVQVKHDGSPSIVFGHHPENGKFFVASKSAFNKDPKINYTPEDIEKNHGHAPGLVTKLKAALKHIPKVAPKEGVYQGDVMYSRGEDEQDDVQKAGDSFHFRPNTITYSTPTTSSEGRKIKDAKFGMLVHTGYKGNTFADMKADFTPDKSVFGKHKDVHLFDNSQEFEGTKYTKAQQAKFQHHMNAARAEQAGSNMDNLGAQDEHIKTYINQTVKTRSVPTVEDYRDHVSNKFLRKMADLKTEKAKNAKSEELNGLLNHVDKHKKDFESAFEIHHHLTQAKKHLIDALGTHQRYKHTIEGKESKPEGYVIVRNNRPSKLVDREDFSAANFAFSANRKKA